MVWYQRVEKMGRSEMLVFIRKVIEEDCNPEELSLEMLNDKIQKLRERGNYHMTRFQEMSLKRQNLSDMRKLSVNNDIAMRYVMDKSYKAACRYTERIDELKALV